MTDPTAAARCPFTDPHRLFADLADARATGGLPRSEALGARVVTRYADVVTALHDPTTFSSRPTVPDIPPPFADLLGGRVPTRGTLLGHDDPDHARLRSAVNGFFVPRRLARYEPWIRERAHRLVDGFVADGAVDLKPQFALPLPLQVIGHLVGLDPDRHEWLHRSLGFFLGPSDPHPGTPQEKAVLLLELHDHLLELMAARCTDRRDDLISHVWDQRDSGAVQMTDFEMLSLFPGLMLAGHETTSNLVCTGLSHLLADPARYAQAMRDDASRAAALEELLRYESAITGMPRLVTRDTELGGEQLHAGEQVFLAYAGASRDPEVFPHPDDLDLDREWSTPHLGFGQGVHACLGAPLARLLLRVELEVLHERLPELALATPYADLDRHPVGGGRGTSSLPLTFRPSAPRAQAVAGPTAPDQVRVVHDVAVVGRRQLTADVVELVLRAPDARAFPAWDAGAHVDLELPGGFVRSYSLVGRDGPDLRVAVLRELTGRGGSAAAHGLREGDRLGVRGPRNHFRLRPAERYVFVAGGIGITPLLGMVEAAEAAGADWSLLHLGRSADRVPYAADLVAAHPDRVEVWTSADRGRYDLAALAAGAAASGAVVHACGPEALLTGLEQAMAAAGVPGSLVVERFAARGDVGPSRPFEVTLARSGRTLPVGAEDSLLDVVNRAGAGLLSTCREGTCGTCEATVVAGVPEHRDAVLSLEEQLAGTTIMTCVSRCRGDRLVLDL